MSTGQERCAADMLAELGALDEHQRRQRVAAIDRARLCGATWAAISGALGYTDRTGAAVWRGRQPEPTPERETPPTQQGRG